MSQYVPRTATIIAKPGNSEELKIHVSEPCTEGSVSSSLTFGWNNVLILTSAVFSARDTCKDACSTKELMTTLFKRRGSELGRNPEELTVTAELRVVRASSSDVTSGSEVNSSLALRGEAAGAVEADSIAQWQTTAQVTSYQIGLRAEMTATPGRTVPTVTADTTTNQHAVHAVALQPFQDNGPLAAGRILNVTQTPMWPVSRNSPGTMDRTATVTAGMDPIGWHQAAELRAMAAYASLAMQNSGAVPFGQPTYDACMYGTPLTGMPGYAVPFMPGVPPLNATPLSEVPAAPEIVWEDNETQPKPRYSYRPAYRCNLCGELKRGHDCPLKQIEVAPRKVKKAVASSDTSGHRARISSKKRRTSSQDTA